MATIDSIWHDHRPRGELAANSSPKSKESCSWTKLLEDRRVLEGVNMKEEKVFGRMGWWGTGSQSLSDYLYI